MKRTTQEKRKLGNPPPQPFFIPDSDSEDSLPKLPKLRKIREEDESTEESSDSEESSSAEESSSEGEEQNTLPRRSGLRKTGRTAALQWDLSEKDIISAEDSTSAFETEEETLRYLNRMIIKLRDENAPKTLRDTKIQFYIRLLPIFIKTEFFGVEMISVQKEFINKIIEKQGVTRDFVFQNFRLFYLDNATLLLEHHYLTRSSKDFIIKIVGVPINKSKASLPRDITEDKTVCVGIGKDNESSRPGIYFAGSHALHKNVFFLRPFVKNPKGRNHKPVVQGEPPRHVFLENEPPTFWWNVYDPKIEGDSFEAKIHSAIADRPIVVEFLFGLGTEYKEGIGIELPAKAVAAWEDDHNPKLAAMYTIHHLLCFGFRILSFGALCEYPKEGTALWIDEKLRGVTVDETKKKGHSKPASADRVKITKTPVMRIAYTLDTQENVIMFIRVMKTYGEFMKKRVLRSRLYYKTTIPWDRIGSCYVYPNNALYMVLGSCNIFYNKKEMTACTKSLTDSKLDDLEDRYRDADDEIMVRRGRKRAKKQRKKKGAGTAATGGVKSSKSDAVKQQPDAGVNQAATDTASSIFDFEDAGSHCTGGEMANDVVYRTDVPSKFKFGNPEKPARPGKRPIPPSLDINFLPAGSDMAVASKALKTNRPDDYDGSVSWRRAGGEGPISVPAKKKQFTISPGPLSSEPVCVGEKFPVIE